MIVNPAPGLTPRAGPAEPRLTTGVPDRVAVAVTGALVSAPLGESPLVEAAYAWHRLRVPHVVYAKPPSDPASPGRWPRVPVVETHVEEVAVRLARLLSGLTWATVGRVEPSACPPQPALVRVEVPAALYHRVQRALAMAWRSAQSLWDRPTTTEKERHGAAVGLWRMAILLDGIGSHRGAISVRVSTRTEAGLLARAGEFLGVLPPVDRVRGGFVVVVCGPCHVLRILGEAGAGKPAYAWAKGHRNAASSPDLT